MEPHNNDSVNADDLALQQSSDPLHYSICDANEREQQILRIRTVSRRMFIAGTYVSK